VTTTTPESDETNNDASEDTTVEALSDLSIEKDDDVDPVTAGENLTYTVTVSNSGP
jgi:hypothetical protein